MSQTEPGHASNSTSITEEHYAEEFQPRHFEATVEIWCPVVDETKVVLGAAYVDHCVMCGETITVATRGDDGDE